MTILQIKAQVQTPRTLPIGRPDCPGIFEIKQNWPGSYEVNYYGMPVEELLEHLDALADEMIGPSAAPNELSSICCGASIYENTDVCAAYKEHCIPDTAE